MSSEEGDIISNPQDELLGTIVPQGKRTIPIHVHAAYTYPNSEEEKVIDEAIIDIVLHLKNL